MNASWQFGIGMGRQKGAGSLRHPSSPSQVVPIEPIVVAALLAPVLRSPALRRMFAFHEGDQILASRG